MKLYPPASSLQLKRTTMLVIMSYWPLSTPAKNGDIVQRELTILSSCGLTIKTSHICVLPRG